MRFTRRELLQGGAAVVAAEPMSWAAAVPVPLGEELGRHWVWVAGADMTKAGDQHAVFWRAFDVAGEVGPAEMHVFAYTRYRLYVNGVYVGRGPSRFENQRPEYDSWSLAGRLQPGRNVVAVLVHRDMPCGRVMHHAPGMTAMVVWGGGRVVTDMQWRAAVEASYGPRKGVWSSIPEVVDAGKMPDWTDAAFDGGRWEPAVPVVPDATYFPLWPRTTPLQMERERVVTGGQTERLEAGGVAELSVEELVQAYSVLDMESDAGSEVEVRYLLPEGKSSGVNMYTTRGGSVERYMSGDTFALTGIRVTVQRGAVRLTKVRVVEVRYPLERVGRFACSDGYLDKLWRLCARSLEVLSEDAYVDCADRERVEWTDNTPPAFECTRVMMAGPKPGGGMWWGDGRLVKALLLRIALTQKPDGQIKAHSCSERWDIHALMEDRSCDWVNLARQYYDCSGDAGTVRMIWPAMVRLMDWFLSKRTERGLVLAREWEVWDNPLRYVVCEGAGLNAFVYGALVDAAYLGDRIGARSEANRFRQAAAELQRAFDRVFWDEGAGAYLGGLVGVADEQRKVAAGAFRPTLQAGLFALLSGVALAERVERVRAFCVAHSGETSAAMSHFYLWKVLYGMDAAELDVAVLAGMRKAWRAQVDSVWGTSWETPHGGSRVHIYGILPGYFLSAYVLGVRVDGPVSGRTIVVEPRVGDLTWAEGVVVTEYGPVRVGWKRVGASGLRLEVTVPEGVVGRVRLRGTGILVNGQRMKATLVEGRQEVRLGAGISLVEGSDAC